VDKEKGFANEDWQCFGEDLELGERGEEAGYFEGKL